MTWQDQGRRAAEGYYIEEEDENPEEFDIAMMRGFCTLLTRSYRRSADSDRGRRRRRGLHIVEES